MDEKITFLKEEVKKVCSDFLNRLEGEDLVKAYFLLNDLSSSKLAITKNTKVSSNANTFDDFEGLLVQYENKLKATGKAKITIKNYMVEVGKFLIFLQKSNHNLEFLNSQILDNYLSATKSERRLERNAYSKLVIIIRGFLHFLYKSKIIQEDLSSELKVPKKVRKEREFLSSGDIGKIELYLENRKDKYHCETLRDRVILYLGLYTGLRKSEIIKLNWSDINLNEGKIKVLNSKGGKDRVVYFNGNIKEILADYRKKTNSYEGSVIRGVFKKRITGTSLHNTVIKIYKQSGIYRQGLTVHSLRHSFAELLRSKNVDLKVIQILMGHQSLETTDLYLHVSSKDLKGAVL